MKLDPKQTAFGRHETFPLRYAWLTKGFEALQALPNIFSQPDRAMVLLGVGRNMVSAIQYRGPSRHDGFHRSGTGD